VNADPRDDRIAELERANAKLERANAKLEREKGKVEREKAELLVHVSELEAKVAKLIEKVNRNSSNSSKPPSSDGPAKTPRRERSKSGRKRGGQPGHKGHQRKLVPIEEVAHLEIVEPRQCDCGGEVRVDSEDVKRHQVVHIPPVVAEVHEYQLLGGACERCGMHVRANVPDGVAKGAFGPSVIAMIATLIGAYRLSKRQVVQVMQTIFGVTVSIQVLASSP
jgi:transposase